MYCGNDVIVKKAIADAVAAKIPQLLKLAKAALEAENYEEALQQYTKILEFDSENFEAWFGKGLSSGHILGKVKDADVSFKKALELNPSASLSIQEAKDKVYSFQANHFYEKAKECYERGQVHLESATYTYTEREDDFLGNLARKIEAERIAKSSALAKGKPDYMEALKYIDQAIALQPINCEFLLLKDSISVALQDPKLSLSSWINALEIVENKSQEDPNNLKLLETKYYAADRLGNKELVKLTKQAIASIDPDHFLVKKKGMCFIATAVYGNPFAYEIEFLRYWRDEYLLKNTLGNLFVKIYYRISPPIADWISKSEKRKSTVRFILDRFIKYLKKTNR